MKNVTITVEEKVLRWAKVWAARNDSSVSRLVGVLLKRKMEEDEEYETARIQYFSREPLNLRASGRYPKREELYDRPGVR